MQHRLIEQIVARIRTWERPLDEFSEVESAEFAVVDGREGLTVLWIQGTTDQGVRRFGLLVTAEDLAAYEDDADTLLADLRLMVKEPHGTEADERTRTRFRSFTPFGILPWP